MTISIMCRSTGRWQNLHSRYVNEYTPPESYPQTLLTDIDCIANYTRQPLLSLSGCDIGPMENAEVKVQHWFDLAKVWDALLLIDEADIFLTWRQPDNTERNSLVSGNCLNLKLSSSDTKSQP